jgi:hypothetical protein
MSITNNPITHIPKYRSDEEAQELWEIIELSRQDFNQCMEAIKSLDRKSLIRLYWNYLSVQANFLYEPYRIEDYSDGLNDNIGHWIVAQGKEYCYRVLNDPKSVPRLEDLDGNFDCEPRIVYVIHSEYLERYNKFIPNPDYYPDEFWDIIYLGIESIQRLIEAAKSMNREELLKFIHTYEAVMEKFERRFMYSLSCNNIEPQNLEYSVRDLSKWVVAQGREDFCDYLDNIVEYYDLPMDLSEPKMAILDAIARECEQRYYSYPSDKFWEIITLAKQDFNQFREQVEQMSGEQMIRFAQELREAGNTQLQALAEPRYYNSPEFSEFDLNVMWKWIIARGRKYYAKMIAHPYLIPREKIHYSDPDAAIIFDIVDTIYDEYFDRYNEPIDDE